LEGIRALIVENEVQRIDNQSESATTQPKRARATPATRRRNASQLQTTKKGDTGIRKPPDTSLSDSYSERKLILFINRYGIVLKKRIQNVYIKYTYNIVEILKIMKIIYNFAFMIDDA
jgi:hypothetical protein